MLADQIEYTIAVLEKALDAITETGSKINMFHKYSEQFTIDIAYLKVLCQVLSRCPEAHFIDIYVFQDSSVGIQQSVDELTVYNKLHEPIDVDDETVEQIIDALYRDDWKPLNALMAGSLGAKHKINKAMIENVPEWL